MKSNHCGHQWMIALTQKLSECELDLELKNILEHLLEDSYFALYMDKNVGVQPQPICVFASQGFPAYNSKQVSNAMQTLDSELVRISGQDGKHCFFPMHRNGKLIGFVVAQSKVLAKLENAFVITNILNIYANQQYLLYRSRLDPLTELLNRQSFDSEVMDILQQNHLLSELGDVPNWFLAMIDIDHFKEVNDNFGHVIGDEVIILVARMLRDSFDHKDFVFRYGGEEFTVLFRANDMQQAKQMLDACRRNIAKREFPRVKSLTVSCGFCQLIGSDMVPQLVQKADTALYAAKNGGRNQVVNFHELPTANLSGDYGEGFDDDMLELF
ncbi:GGDEF domain-containing protein [Pseudoalteromonas pernae]|uniref:GGDEF domain-containing protein n=1 Tax=Pseudoalteromonas pernae TaxID=3118054 RepID=UPI003242949F